MNFTEHPDFPAALSLAEQLADVGRGIAVRHFRTPLAVERKGDGSPVTVADREIETQMRRMIRAAFPGHAIRGEEFASEGSGEFTWVLDPIDGTKSFITGFPLFGSLIALLQGGRPVLGVIEAPALGERWVGCEGRPTLFNGRQVKTSACRATGPAVRRLHDHAGDLRRLGTAARRSPQRARRAASLWRGLLPLRHARGRSL